MLVYIHLINKLSGQRSDISPDIRYICQFVTGEKKGGKKKKHALHSSDCNVYLTQVNYYSKYKLLLSFKPNLLKILTKLQISPPPPNPPKLKKSHQTPALLLVLCQTNIGIISKATFGELLIQVEYSLAFPSMQTPSLSELS